MFNSFQGLSYIRWIRLVSKLRVGSIDGRRAFDAPVVVCIEVLLTRFREISMLYIALKGVEGAVTAGWKCG